MTPTIKNKFLQSLNIGLFAISIGLVNAAPTDLGSAPLVSATTGDVLPNLMYILDNSGSMARDYMPDYVNDSNKCKTTGTSGNFTSSCAYGDPAYNTKDFNSIYYNPAVTYSPSINADGSSRTEMTSANTAGWTVVPNDAYGIYSTSNTSLVPTSSTTGYLDRVWCNKTSGVTTTDLLDPLVCRKNSQYIYPNNTGTQATSFNQPYNARGYPYYYTVAAGEYCTNKNLTTCITASAPTATHTFPAKLRWCSSAANVLTGIGCQEKYNEVTNHTFAKWTGIATSTSGKIKFNADTLGCGVTGTPSCTAPSAMSITNITVNGVSIVPSTPSPALTITNTTSAADRSQLARNVRDAINNHVSVPDDFVATASGDEVTIQPLVGAPSGVIALTFSASPTVAPVAGTAPSNGSINISAVGRNRTVSIRCGATYIGQSGTFTSSNSTTASTRLNTLHATLNGTTVNGYTMSCSKSPNTTSPTSVSCSVSAPVGVSACSGGFNVDSDITTTLNTGPSGGSNGVSGKTYTIPYVVAQFTGGTPVVTTFNRVDIEPYTAEYPKASTRTDCAGATCSYNEEMTNFANWYSYYRTRMQMMKTSTSHAFRTIDSRFRVGFITISNLSTNYLPIAQFGATQKADWYAKLFAASGNSGTPLRSALTTVGRIYAGKNPVSGFTADPVQYSCQQNFSILTTDGYWNTDSNSNVLNVAGSGSVGNLDGGTTPRPMYEGTTAVSNSLADAAKYYYDTDLRTTTLSNCTGGTRVDGTTGDVCENNVFVTTTDNNLKQHMTTFTLGLGVDASLTYTSDYKTAEEGDFYELKQGTRNWPVPVADSQTAVDDLWHAAVNGQGTYFSAKDPNQLASSLSEALSSIKAKVGAGAAAATSTLNPVSGDNFTYVASYTSVKWIGNLEARTVNTDTGKVSEDANWCLENVVADVCASPSSVVATTSGSSTIYQCVTPGASASTCTSPGVLDGTDCKVEISTSCTGTLQNLVTNEVDTRNIFMNVNGTIGNFTAANLIATGKNTNFESAFLSTNLNQWSTLSTAQRLLVNSTSLVNFLRGNTGFEDRASNVDGAIDTRIYRFRETTLGDLVDSTPVYVGAPKANFSDPGYGPNTSPSSFKTAQATRAGTVYIGANDGMIHAIDASNGQERWAYVPTMVLDNMWKLASNNYGGAHSYYVNGDIVVNDICTAGCTSATTAVWKTILVGGLNGGGKGYFALDVTNPNTPTLLWEFDAADDADIGYSYGNPIITKKADGSWVVVVTSGYNNTGVGYMYVLNAATGSVLSKYSTGAGTATTPSGLAKINAYIADGVINNTAVFIYGGDLLGNLWRFDINSAQSATNPFKLAILKDPSGNPQPITVRPELADISGKRVLYIGTGRYLGTSDLTDTQQQSIYAISDDATSTPTTLDNPRSSATMVKQILVNDTATATRGMQTPSNPVSFTTDRGWYIDFPDSGERQNVPAQLVFGTLLLPTTVPSNTVCSPGGYGWLNFLDYRTGAAVAGNVVASRTNAPIVGINVLYVKGKPVVNIVTADNPTPSFPPVQPTFTGGSQSGFTNHRVIWRELIEEQQ
jgi:type IV pilus assembly protein PilY1